MSDVAAAFQFTKPARVAAARPGAGSARGVSLPVYLSMMFVVSVYAAALTPTVRWATGAGVLTPGDSDTGSMLTQVFALGVVGFWALKDLRKFRAIARGVLPYLVIAGLCFASALWSNYSYNSVRRSITLTVCILYGAYLYDQLGLEGMIRMFARLATGLALASIFLYFAMPTLGRDSGFGYENAMRGVFGSKNTAGMAMLLALPCVIYLGSLPGANKLKYLVSGVFLFGALLMTRSATSTLIGLIVVALGSRLWMRSQGLRLTWIAGLLTVLVMIAGFLVIAPDQIFAVLGRDSSLTGRVPLWEEAFNLIAKRPWLGYGYSGFWNAESRDVQYLWLKITWTAPNAHNGYIDLLLQIGIIGLCFYLAMWLLIIVRSARHAIRGTMPTAGWILLSMTVNMLLNINEGPLPYADEFTLFVGASLLALFHADQNVARQLAITDSAPAANRGPALAGLPPAGRSGRGRFWN